jgi:nicotinate phosphoribosyltransferase
MRGEIERDILALADEEAISGGEPLLVEIFKHGGVVYELPKLSQIRERAMNNVSRLPEGFRDLIQSRPSPMSLSKRLRDLSESLWQQPEQRTVQG